MPKIVTRTLLALVVGTALILVSCGPQAAPAPAPTPTPAPGAVTPTPTPVAPTPTPAPSAVEKPKYGGTINVIQPSFTDKFDIAVSPG